MKKVVFMIVLLVMSFPLKAQSAKPVDREGSLFSAGVDSRSAEGSPNFTDTFYLFTPSLFLESRYSPNTRLSADYTSEFEMFGEHRELNSWNHSGHLGYARKFSPRFSFDMGDSFISTTDPSRKLANSFLLFPRSRYQENVFYVRGDYSLNPRTTLSFGFDNTVTRYGLAAEDRKNFFDQMGNAWTTTLFRQLSEGKKITATYTLLHLSILDSPGLPANAGSGIASPMHSVAVGYLNSSRQDWSVGISAGLIRAASFSYALSGQIRRRMGAVWLDAEYNRTLSFFGSQAFDSPGSAQIGAGLPAGNRYEMVTLGASGDFSRRVGLNLRVTGAWTGAGSGAPISKSLIGALSLDYRITRRLALYTVAEFYSQNLHRFPGYPVSRHRFYAGLRWSFPLRRMEPGSGSQSLPASRPIQTSHNKEE